MHNVYYFIHQIYIIYICDLNTCLIYHFIQHCFLLSVLNMWRRNRIIHIVLKITMYIYVLYIAISYEPNNTRICTNIHITYCCCALFINIFLCFFFLHQQINLTNKSGVCEIIIIIIFFSSHRFCRSECRK